MKNIDLSPQVKARLESIANKDISPTYDSWKKRLIKSHKEYLRLTSITNKFIINNSFDDLTGVRENQVYDLMDILWTDDAFGSVGRGEVSEKTLKENLEVFYYATRDLLHSQLRDALPSVVLRTIRLRVDDRGELRAIKLRALSIVSDLRTPSLISDKYFFKITKKLKAYI